MASKVLHVVSRSLMHSSALRKLPIRVWCERLVALVLLAAVSGLWHFLASYFGYKRYLISAESLLAVLVLGVGWRWVAATIFAATMALESALALVSSLKLFNIHQVFAMASFAAEANGGYQSWALASLVAMVCFWWLLVRVMPKVGLRSIGHLILGLMLVQAGISFAAGNFWRPVVLAQSQLVLGSAALFLREQLGLNAQVYELTRDDVMEYVPTKHPTAVQLTWGPGFPSARKVLLVVAESWGLPNDPAMLEDQLAPLRSMRGAGQAQLQLQAGSIHALGYTAMGELRELCGRLPVNAHLKKTSAEGVGECLPARMVLNGYRTFGVHGAASTMYDRKEWYPALGIEQMLFSEQMAEKTSRQCYSFPGLCDAELFSVVADIFRSEQPTFVYWLSLNSHLPYDRRDVTTEQDSSCRQVLQPDHDEQLCSYHLLQRQFFQGLGSLLAMPVMRGAEVLVVGDHPPPFNTASSRSKFVSERVPYLHVVVP